MSKINECYSQSILKTTPGKLITIKHASRLLFDKTLGVDAQRLIGDVQCEHDGALLNCDSAYLFSNKTLEAYGHIVINKGDSVMVYGDSLRYDASTKLAHIKGNVKCIEKEMTLTTKVLTYDLDKSVASYYNGGTIVNKENTLNSKNGHYYSANKELAFHYDVTLVSPDYKIRGDTMRYNTTNKITYFLGPSIITAKDSSYIYCENGWYDTDKEIARFSKNAIVVYKNQKLLGDSIFYDRKKGYSRATKNVRIIDTANKTFIVGNYAVHYEKGNRAVVTGSALFASQIEKDTLYISADTLFYSESDSLHTFLKAYRHVKIFKKDLQGLCDSLVYGSYDSLMHMYNTPILWTNNSQITAKQINVIAGKHSNVSFFELNNNALVIQKVDSLDEDKFNQITGRRIEGFISHDTVRKLNVQNNAQIIYYIKQKNNYKGVNKTACSDLSVWFNAEGVDRATFRNKPEATIFPLKDFDDKEMRFKNFVWMEHKRPKKLIDIIAK